MKYVYEQVRSQDMFGQSIGFTYSKQEEQFKSSCSGLISIGIKVLLVLVVYLRSMAIVNKSDNLYGLFENVIDEDVVNQVKLEDEGFLVYF